MLCISRSPSPALAIFCPREEWFWLLVVGCWLLVVGCWLLVVGCWLLVVGCWLLVVGCCCFRHRLTRQRCLCRHNCTSELADPVPSHLGVRLPATPAPPWSPRRRRTLHRRGARKTGAQLRDNRRSAKNDAKCVKKPIIAAISKTAGSSAPSELHNWNVRCHRR